MKCSDWRNAPGPGDLWHPPDDPPDEEPRIDTIYRFRRPRIINGALCVEFREVDVDDETREVVSYGRVVRRPCWRHFTYGAQIRKWASKHPRVGPAYLAALEAIK